MESLVIVGGGFIGIEMALAFARRGVAVTMIIRSTRLGSGEDDAFTQVMRITLEQAGVHILYNTVIEQGDNNTLTLTTTEADTLSRNAIVYSYILLALGRVPNTG